MEYKTAVLDLLNSVSSDPNSLDMPTWSTLVTASGKSKATLWRDKEIYAAYTRARNAKIKCRAIAQSKSSLYRRTLEQKIYFLQRELDEARAIANAHIVKFQEISQYLRTQGIDPVLVMGNE